MGKRSLLNLTYVSQSPMRNKRDDSSRGGEPSWRERDETFPFEPYYGMTPSRTVRGGRWDEGLLVIGQIGGLLIPPSYTVCQEIGILFENTESLCFLMVWLVWPAPFLLQGNREERKLARAKGEGEEVSHTSRVKAESNTMWLCDFSSTRRTNQPKALVPREVCTEKRTIKV